MLDSWALEKYMHSSPMCHTQIIKSSVVFGWRWSEEVETLVGGGAWDLNYRKHF